MFLKVIVAVLLFAAGSHFASANAPAPDLEIFNDPDSGMQIGAPRSMTGSKSLNQNGVAWRSEDGRLEVSTLRFPATRPLNDIYYKIRGRKGRQITRNVVSSVHFLLEGSDQDGVHFIVRVEEIAGEKRGLSISFRPQNQPDLALLAQEIAASYKSPGERALHPLPGDSIEMTVGGPTPKSEAELTRFQRQALQAQLTALGHNGSEGNGIFGPGTRRAIKSYQRTYRGPETGILTAQDINQLMQRGVYIPEIIRLEGRDRFTFVDYDPLNKEQCDSVRTDLASMAAAARVRFDRTQAEAGADIGLSWLFTPQPRRRPMYLIIAFDQPMRFSGRGYYVLMPGARAPFGISHANDKTRVVVPLYVSGGATTRAIRVAPVLAGSLGADAAIVAPTGCGEQLATVLPPTRLTVNPGKPVIEINEETRLDAALQTIVSPSNDRLIEVVGENTFRLLDSQTGQVVASLPGKEPRFSPTGRYITSKIEDYVTIRDALDGQEMSTFGDDFSWDNKDSFIIHGQIGLGGVDVRYPAVLGESGGSFAGGCRVCTGLGESTVKIDLENNLVLTASRQEPTIRNAYSLSEEMSSSDYIAPHDSMPRYGSEFQFAEATSRIVTLRFPTDWEFIEKPQFPYLSTDLPAEVEPNSPRLRFYRPEMAPVLRSASADFPQGVIQRAASGSLLRNVSALVSEFDARPSSRSFAARLADFGINEHPSIAFAPVADPLTPTKIRKVDWRGDRYTVHAYKNDPKIRIDSEANDCGLSAATPDRDGGITVTAQRSGFFIVSVGSHTLTLVGGGCIAGSMGDSDPIFGVIDSRKPGAMRPIISGVPFWEIRNPGGACEGAACDYHVAISHERYLLVWSSFSASVELIDLEKGQTLAFVPFRGDAMANLALTPDARMLVQRNKDGTFAVHDVRLGVPVDQFSYSNGGRMSLGSARTAVIYGRYADDEIAVWTPSGHFDATYEGAAQVHLRFAGLSDLYSFDQFAAIMHRPGLAKRVMDGAFADSPVVYKIPPTIAGTIRPEGDAIQLVLRQTSGKRLRRVIVYQDGLQSNDVTPDETAEISMSIRRLAGVRWVAAVAIDEEGLVSRPVIADLGAAPSSRSLRILGVGVDEYAHPALSKLAFAKSDVKRVIAAAVGAKSQVYSRVEPLMFQDAGATPISVTDALRRMVRESSVDSDIMLVFAGHGLKGSDGRYYLALSQTRLDDLKTTALGWDEISQIVAQAKARVLVILDSCHSGDAGKGLLSTNDDVTAGMLSTAGNVVVFSGSKGREYSLEHPSVGGGFFSAAIAEAFTTQGSDQNANGVVEASEMYAAVKRSVVTKTRKMQTPWIARNKMIGDFSVF
jgi:hypothetical protein